MDLAKAFDTLNHKILLSKLEQYGIRGLANEVIRGFFFAGKHTHWRTTR